MDEEFDLEGVSNSIETFAWVDEGLAELRGWEADGDLERKF